MTWNELSIKFRKLGEITGASKSSSWSMSVNFSPEGKVQVELGGYDVPGWNRHHFLTNDGFPDEHTALEATGKAIELAEKLVSRGDFEGYTASTADGQE